MNWKFLFCIASALFLISQSCLATGAGNAQIIGLSAPTGMAIDKDGRIYVSEWGANRISRIEDGRKSIILENISAPAGLALADDGNLYIAGYGDGKIHVFNGNGKPRILADGLSAPTGLLLDTDGRLLVANRNAGEVVRIDGEGNREVISRGHKTPGGCYQTNFLIFSLGSLT